MVHYFFIFVLNCYCWVIFVLSSYIFLYIYCIVICNENSIFQKYLFDSSWYSVNSMVIPGFMFLSYFSICIHTDNADFNIWSWIEYYSCDSHHTNIFGRAMAVNIQKHIFAPKLVLVDF